MEAAKTTITVKLIDRIGEPIEYKNVRSFTVMEGRGGALIFIAEDGVEHTTNAEYHITDSPTKE